MLRALESADRHTCYTVDLPPSFGPKQSGKVRDIYTVGEQKILITTDRVSAFDRVLTTIPHKGQVLNQMAAWWFEQVKGFVPNHVVAVPDENVTIARVAQPLPVEVVVRGYITGVTSTSLWTLYEGGEREPYGVRLPEGLKKNGRLPRPILTPTTKAEQGQHDERITAGQVVERGLVEPRLWEQIEAVALALFARGQAVAETAGLVLVDTKYEFGLIDGELTLIDEIHTPDSSRYWTLESYSRGNPISFDKEFLREWYVAQGYRGEGTIPTMPDEVRAQVAARYIAVYEQLTGKGFVPGAEPVEQRIARNLLHYFAEVKA
jgi:phosphoribosylaminoimidazole-succinocarboxamide synthase